MKINYILPFAVLAVFLGCAPQIIGTNFDNYVTNVGVPNSSYKLQNGHTLYSYKKPCKYYPSEWQDYTIETDEQNIIIKKTENKVCRIDYEKQKEERANKSKVARVLDDLFPDYEN